MNYRIELEPFGIDRERCSNRDGIQPPRRVIRPIEYDPVRTHFEVISDEMVDVWRDAATKVSGAQVVTDTGGGGRFILRDGGWVDVPEKHQRVRVQVNEPDDFTKLWAEVKRLTESLKQ